MSISLTTVKNATVVTHPAPHHADEAMAVVILNIVEGNVNVLRTRNPKEIEEAVASHATICDVGGVYDPETNRFDHHQRDFVETREDGTKYSSAGLIWKKYGVAACVRLTGCSLNQAKAASVKVDEMLIKGIDAIDNGQVATNEGTMSISQAISILNPNWDEPNRDGYFLEACQITETILTRTIMSCVATVRGQDTVEAAIEASEDSIVILPQFIGGWIETVTRSTNPKAANLLYGVFRNLQGQWNVQAIPPAGQPMAQRKPLPEAWRGQSAAALQEITGVEDAVFCHVGGFICGAKTRDGAIKLAHLATKA